MPELYYTAVIKDGKVLTVDGLVYAEHFEDAAECDKRAKQFASMCHGDDGNALYAGKEPPEYALAFAKYLEDHPQPSDMGQSERDAIMGKAQEAGVAAGKKTVSVLTAPEVDDSGEARGLPDWAIAQHAVEAATQAVIEAKADAEAKKLRAQQLADYAQGQRAPDSDPVGKEAMNRARANAEGAQLEADRATGRLYMAENDLKDKVAAYDKIKPKEGKNA